MFHIIFTCVLVMIGMLGFVTCADPTNSKSESSTEPFGASSSSGEAPVRNYTYEVVNTYPHDSGAYTQGLMIEGEKVFEGTGLRGRSSGIGEKKERHQCNKLMMRGAAEAS